MLVKVQYEVFAVLTILLTALCIGLGVTVMRRKDGSRSMAVCMICSGLVALFYLISISVDQLAQKTLMSVYASLYFFFIDLMVVSFSDFIMEYTRTQQTKLRRNFRRAVNAFLVFDAVSLLGNPLHGQTVRFAYDADHIQAWRYVNTPLFYMHLVFVYAILLYAIVRLIDRMIEVPHSYRGRYMLILAALLGVIAANGLFLYLPNNHLIDFSVLFYSVMDIMIYSCTYHYSPERLLQISRETILEGISTPIVLFDFEDRFVLCNAVASTVVPEEKQNDSYTLRAFIEEHGMSEQIHDPDKPVTFLWTDKTADPIKNYRCDYKNVTEGTGIVIGRMIVLSDNTLETDLLTGFHSHAVFRQDFYNGRASVYPAAVAICDLNKLSQINHQAGTEAGDQAIALLADVMREKLPQDTYFARMTDANLLAVCPGFNNAQMQTVLEAIRKTLSCSSFAGITLDMQCAVQVATENDPDIIKAAEIAEKSMRTKKLLDSSSAHASLLDSLARAQEESDNTTEAHVQRTRHMGELLGRRLGLNDSELGKLSLLCLLHDIGKLGIPLEILNKPGRLTPEEWTVMCSHVRKGYNITNASAELRDISDLVLHHHESWDGSGYPDKLCGEAIPMLDRIIAVVDSYDAMTNDRPYRRALPKEKAREELRACAGRQFDPKVVAEYLAMLEEIEEAEPVQSDEKEETDTIRPMGMENDLDQDDPDAGVYNVNYGFYILDENMNIIHINQTFTQMTGYTLEDVHSYKLKQNDLVPPQDVNRYNETVQYKLSNNDSAYLEHRIRRKDGAIINVLCFGRVRYEASVKSIRSEIVIVDVKETAAARALRRELIESQQRALGFMEERARQDTLTGLWNHNAFQNYVEMRLLGNDRIAMLMMDIDRFKQCNDTFGHQRGDAILREVGRIISNALPENASACRMGGDEFAVAVYLEEGASAEQVRSAAEKYWKKISDALAAYDDSVSFSGGLAIAEGKSSFRQLYAEADKLMYAAKEIGGARMMTAEDR